MSAVVQAQIEIGGQEIGRLDALQVIQVTGWHHQIMVSYSPPEDQGIIMNHAEPSIGQQIRINLSYATDVFGGNLIGESNAFVGIVTGIRQTQNLDQVSYQITAQSLTTYLDGPKQTRSFTQKTLQDIVDFILEEYGEQLVDQDSGSIVNQPAYTRPIPYLVQYRENNLQFIARIAAEYGEWFYHDGLNLYFAKPEENEITELSFSEGNLISFQIDLQTQSANFLYKGYDPEKHEYPKYEPEPDNSLHPYAEFVYNKSKDEIFGSKGPGLTTLGRNLPENEVNRIASIRQQKAISEMLLLKGSSTDVHLRVGSFIEIQPNAPGGGPGGFIITMIEHHWQGDGSYFNRFEAIPKEAMIPIQYVDQVAPPFCEAQQAEVVDTNDPDGLGRIKVVFNWQQDTNETSPWIRLLSPYSGGDKGFFFVPEKGDAIWVDFEHHDPDHPVAISSLYHGKAKPGGQDPENNTKSWVTRSGNTISLSDKTGEESITISSPGGKNVITFLGSSKPSLSISSNGDISISATENLILNGKNIILSASNQLGFSGKFAGIEGTGTDPDGNSIVLSGSKIVVSGKEEAILTGKKTAVAGDTEVAVTAMAIKLNS